MAVIAMTFSWVRHDPVSDMTGYNLKYCPVFMCRHTGLSISHMQFTSLKIQYHKKKN